MNIANTIYMYTYIYTRVHAHTLTHTQTHQETGKFDRMSQQGDLPNLIISSFKVKYATG